jgi:hypothetical protein
MTEKDHFRTKSGETPDLTGGTPVPPCKLHSLHDEPEKRKIGWTTFIYLPRAQMGDLFMGSY